MKTVKKWKMGWLLIFTIFIVCEPVIAKTLHDVPVTKVIDGDTIVVNDGIKNIKVRLWGIDTPEYRQPYSKSAKKFTTKLLQYELVDLVIKDYDKYGRVVAMVIMKDGDSINELLVKKGYAWVHIYYCKEAICKTWKSYQREARERKAGLWREPEPLAPWIYKQKYKKR